MTQDVFMISKYGDVYKGNYTTSGYIHPYPGRAEEQYDEIYNAIKWFYTEIKSGSIMSVVDKIVSIDLSNVAREYGTDFDVEEALMYLFEDPVEFSDEALRAIDSIWTEVSAKPYDEINSIPYRETLANYLNQNYLRVRIGGKYNYERENSIYFRISSKGYDWRSIIVNFLWDTYGDPNSMPDTIWVVHDEETNPPEVILFKGSPGELLEYTDTKKFENYRKSKPDLSSKVGNRARRLSDSQRFYRKYFSLVDNRWI